MHKLWLVAAAAALQTIFHKAYTTLGIIPPLYYVCSLGRIFSHLNKNRHFVILSQSFAFLSILWTVVWRQQGTMPLFWGSVGHEIDSIIIDHIIIRNVSRCVATLRATVQNRDAITLHLGNDQQQKKSEVIDSCCLADCSQRVVQLTREAHVATCVMSRLPHHSCKCDIVTPQVVGWN